MLGRTDAETATVGRADYMYVYYDNYMASHAVDTLSIEGYDRVMVKAIDYERSSFAEGETPVIEIDGRRLDPDTVLDSLLSQSGFSRANMPSEEWLDRHSREFLTYKSDSVAIVFERMQIVNLDGKWTITSADDIFTVIK